jgi:hypothetical protein
VAICDGDYSTISVANALPSVGSLTGYLLIHVPTWQQENHLKPNSKPFPWRAGHTTTATTGLLRRKTLVRPFSSPRSVGTIPCESMCVALR